VPIPDRDHLAVVARAGLHDRAAGLTDGPRLGLSIVRQVADLHGASVSAGNADGGGAVMTVVFPPLSDLDDA
jgi:signal transduction histidine kinase